MSISGKKYANLAANIIGTINQYVGDNDPSEDAVGVILRLIGLTNTVNNDDPTQTFVSSFAQRKDQASVNAKTTFGGYLEGFKSRIQKWKRDTNVTRINQIMRLIGPSDQIPPDAGITADDSFAVAVQKVQVFLKKLSDQQNAVGTLTAQKAVYDAASDKMDVLVGTLPVTELGNFGSEIVALLRADSGFITTMSDQLKRKINALTVELLKLQKQEQYILTGISLQNTQQGTVSLLQIVEILLYLIEKIQYTCKECFYFSGTKCVYGGNNLDTVPTNSCLEVYKRSDNPFWRVSDATLTTVTAYAEGLTNGN